MTGLDISFPSSCASAAGIGYTPRWECVSISRNAGHLERRGPSRRSNSAEGTRPGASGGVDQTIHAWQIIESALTKLMRVGGTPASSAARSISTRTRLYARRGSPFACTE